MSKDLNQCHFFLPSASTQLGEVQAACVELMARDGPVSLMDNTQGQLCPSYPLQIVLPRATQVRPLPTE